MVWKLWNEAIIQIAVNLNGVMFKKAEIEGNLSQFYLKIFEKIYTEDFASEEEFLFIFGEMGG
ncbi:MAG: hypothetical protein QXQ18_01955 [Candidatus Aenigmatarchaeota archaeon]